MTRTICELQRTPPAGRRRREWSLLCAAVAFALAAGMGLTGCEKPPTWDELIHGKKKDEKATPVVQQASSNAAPAPAPVAKPAPPKKTPQEVIATFQATPPQKRNDSILGELAALPQGLEQFTEMNLTQSGVTDAGIAVLPKFERIETLIIDSCQYSNAALKNVAGMRGLTALSMAYGAARSKDTDEGLAHIKGMRQLTSLRLDHGKFTHEGLAQLAEMTGLESLSVEDTNFTDENLAAIAGLTGLKELNISSTYVTDAGLLNLVPFKQLEILKMNGMRSHLSGSGLLELVFKKKGLGNLRGIYVSFNQQLQLPAYDAIRRLKKLEILDISDTALTDANFMGCVKPLAKLQELWVVFNPGLTSDALQVLKGKKLKKLVFDRNTGITDAALTYIMTLKSLEVLQLNSTACSENAVKVLKKKLPDCVIYFNNRKIEN